MVNVDSFAILVGSGARDVGGAPLGYSPLSSNVIKVVMKAILHYLAVKCLPDIVLKVNVIPGSGEKSPCGRFPPVKSHESSLIHLVFC